MDRRSLPWKGCWAFPTWKRVGLRTVVHKLVRQPLHFIVIFFWWLIFLNCFCNPLSWYYSAKSLSLVEGSCFYPDLCSAGFGMMHTQLDSTLGVGIYSTETGGEPRWRNSWYPCFRSRNYSQACHHFLACYFHVSFPLLQSLCQHQSTQRVTRVQGAPRDPESLESLGCGQRERGVVLGSDLSSKLLSSMESPVPAHTNEVQGVCISQLH